MSSQIPKETCCLSFSDDHEFLIQIGRFLRSLTEPPLSYDKAFKWPPQSRNTARIAPQPPSHAGRKLLVERGRELARYVLTNSRTPLERLLVFLK